MEYKLNLPSYSLGAKAYEDIPEICGKYGKKIVIIGGQQALDKSLGKITKVLLDHGFTVVDVLWYGGIASMEGAEALAGNKAVIESDMIFAVGGGRAVDTVKVVGDLVNKPVFTLPTLASNCAAITQVSVLYNHCTKEYQELYALNNAPEHCFIDLEVIINSPYEYLWAGIGDALSKEYEVCFSMAGQDLDFINQLGYALAKDCNKIIYKQGLQALVAHKEGKINKALADTVGAIIVRTGYVSVAVDIDYSSSLAHGLYYGATTLPQGEKHLHGAIVNYGTLVLLAMDGDEDNFQQLWQFAQGAKLPCGLKDIGITNWAEVEQMVDFALGTEDLVVVPYAITREQILAAIKLVEEKYE